MPTIVINTPAMSAPRRREVSVRLTRWLYRRGSDRRHVVVRFEETDEGSVFVGGMPVEALPDSGEALHYASVLCCIAEGWDEQFRDELAREIAQALGMTESTALLYIEFRPTSRGDVRFGVAGQLRSAAETGD
ncbi:hypothetical protein INP57_25885 [Saccharopolyspora sp. HNM0986]|uniref:hypothetical protein n=1 Tax=Saccharopolyspora galaxeae TaxID=2781241 RepID=UPI00190DD0BB|nr:hypothetical protein [Saccharopolyspora sp. HNM0986]MBK0870246.1 hypothetical protein [Saccharopolyspora sp. HNM0986]